MRMNASASLLMTAGLGLLCSVAAGPLQAQDDGSDKNPVQPGVGIGVIHVGSSQAAERRDMGKPSGSYPLPGGIQADYWTNEDGTERTFYRRGLIVQMSAMEIVEPLPGNISMKSSVAQVRQAYPGVRLHEYHVNGGGGGGVVDYYDDARRGIAFEFTRPADSGEAPHLYAVIVHKTGMPVIPDTGES